MLVNLLLHFIVELCALTQQGHYKQGLLMGFVYSDIYNRHSGVKAAGRATHFQSV